MQARFLESQNPVLAKRNVLASFTDILLLPVTIVPRAVGAGVGALGSNVGSGLGAVGTGVVQGISKLNPQRWMGASGDAQTAEKTAVEGYQDFTVDGAVFEVGEDESEDEKTGQNEVFDGGADGHGAIGGEVDDEAGWGEIATQRASTGVAVVESPGVSKSAPVEGNVEQVTAATLYSPIWQLQQRLLPPTPRPVCRPRIQNRL